MYFYFAALLLAIYIGYVIILCILNYRKLSHIDGPFFAKIGPFWLMYHTLRGDLYRVLGPSMRQYGVPMRVAPNLVAHDDPDVLRQIYAPRSSFLKGRWYDAMRLGADRDNVMTLFDEKAHAEQRTKLIPGYSGKEVPSTEATVDNFLVQLVSLIRQEGVDKDAPVDFARLAGFLTLDVLIKLAFDLEVGYLRDNTDHFDYQSSVQAFTPIMDLCCNHPAVFRILNSKLIMSVLKPKPEDKKGQGALIGRAHSAVAEHFKDAAKDNAETMIASWKRYGVTQAECEDETMLLILAGSDSTSTALRTTFLHIISTPRVYNALTQEISAAVRQGSISFPVIKFEEATSLPYLSAVIKEGLRIFSPLHGLVTRYSTVPFEINGKSIPAGVEVGISWYDMQRREKDFGSDARQFRPERWLTKDPATLKRYQQILDLAFAGGKSACLGKNLALMELHKAIFELFRNFDFDVVNPLNPMDIRSNSIVTQTNLWVRVRAKATS